MRQFLVEFSVPGVGNLSMRIGAQNSDAAMRAVKAQYPTAVIGAVRTLD